MNQNDRIRNLKEQNYKTDPVNAHYFLKNQLRIYDSIKDRERDFHLVEHALTELGCPDNVKFLREDESFIICPDNEGGIECGMHGHLGPGGTRGSANSLKKMGRKANIGHSHSTGIYDGLFQAGTSSNLDLGYNSGPGSWTHSHILTYPNGQRTIITLWKGRWKA